MDAIDRDLAGIEDHLRTLLRAELPDQALDLPPSTRIPDLGISSLKTLRLIARLELRYGIELEDDIVFTVETLGELAAAVGRVVADEALRRCAS
jgi:acyl carrier protein